MLTLAISVVCILFYLNKIGQTEENMIRPFCDDKHFTAAVRFRFGCKTLKNHFDDTLHFSPFSKLEQRRLVIMNNL